MRGLFPRVLPLLWIVHEKKKKILPEDPDRIHYRISAAMRAYLREKKNIHLPLQLILLDHYGGERINVVAKNDIELAKILLFFDLISAIARKKFGFNGNAESLVPAHINVFATGKEDRLRWDKKFREKKMREQKMHPLTLEDILANEEILGIIATKIASKSKKNVEKGDVLQTLREYIPYIQEIANSYPKEPNFYKKILEEKLDADLVDKLLPQINARMYRAIERFAEKLEEDFGAMELENLESFSTSSEKKSPPTLIDPQAKLEVLSILNGLEFTGFTEEAKRKAVERLSARIAELSEKELTPENLQRLGLYAFAVEMIKRGNFERLREIEEL